ncbi:VOC family protein [Chryseolinea sp. H1M3-3]|uniref:VOC family protein n=1 Tax=Chryseolinea sp. H1M3-3 TaxID=3034144 RepID=UPI0023EA8972|nr:VOC family protein [Chryseolinea sp. H1M3-3]
MQPVELPITSLQHIGIPVTNLEKSKAFYEKLGFTNVMESTFEFNDSQGTCVMMKLGGILMELYQMPSSELGKIKNRNDGHIDHIAFDVTDIDKTFLTLKTAGFIVLEDQPIFLNFWKNGCKFFNIVGPDGERLEFNQIL